MKCPICKEYDDLKLVRLKRTGQEVVVCAECDLLWLQHDNGRLLDADISDVDSFLKAQGLPAAWDELEVIKAL